MPTVLNERFILAEEKALKAKFQGLTVHQPSGGDPIPVEVWWRWPDPEIRRVTWPFIAIDLADVQKSDRREHAGNDLPLKYLPYGYDIADQAGSELVVDEWPTPYDLIYTATVASLDPRHDRELKYKLLGDKARIPHRMAYLETEDNTIRRLDVLAITPTVRRNADLTEFDTIFTLRVETELFTADVEEILRPTNLRMYLVDTTEGVLSEEIAAPL